MFESTEFWHWLVLAAALMVAEAFMPGTFLFWIGLGALLVGLFMVAIPDISWESQMILFVIATGVIVFGWQYYKRRNPMKTDHPNLNRRGAQYVNRVFSLTSPIVDGRGRTKVGDTVWTIEGPDLPAGARIRIKGVDGTILLCEPAPEEAFHE